MLCFEVVCEVLCVQRVSDEIDLHILYSVTLGISPEKQQKSAQTQYTNQQFLPAGAVKCSVFNVSATKTPGSKYIR